MASARPIIFDFDLTLADSRAAAVLCINFALDELGLEVPDEDAARRTVGLSLDETLASLTGATDLGTRKAVDLLVEQRQQARVP